MRDKYLDYKLEELIEDHDFINWVIKGHNNEEWENILSHHPDLSKQAQKAKEIVLMLYNIHNDKLIEGDKLKMWRSINSFDKLQKRSLHVVTFKKVLRYAAVFLLLLFIGIAVNWQLNNPVKSYVFIAESSDYTSGDAKLVLSTGEEIQLKKDNSSIIISGNNEIIIDNEQSIELTDQQIRHEAVKMNEVVIPYGKKSQLVLDDGTKVWLNAGSRLAFPTHFEGKKREVHLQGEAYFEIAHVPGQTFFVNAGDISVKALGTRFNVTAYADDAEILTVLLDGSISINDNTSRGLIKKEIIIKPNQIADFRKDDKTISINNIADVEFYIAWTEGWFKFERESLSSVFRRLERYYNVKIEFNSPFHSSDLISGKLDLKDSLKEVMQALSDVADIDFEITENKVVINKKRE